MRCENDAVDDFENHVRERVFACLTAHKVSHALLALLLLVEAGGVARGAKQEWSMEETKRPRMNGCAPP